MLTWSALQLGDFDKAAREMADVQPEQSGQATVLLKILLGTLGALRHSNKEMRNWAQLRLAGMPRDLANMFLGKNRPVPGKLWPHPTWLPQFRLMLALWLEAKGQKGAAHTIVLPCQDQRYGSSNAQPAIEALLNRTSDKRSHRPK